MAPGSTFITYIKNQNILAVIYFFYFILQFIYLPLQDLILPSNEFKGIDDPLARVGCKYVGGKRHLWDHENPY